MKIKAILLAVLALSLLPLTSISAKNGGGQGGNGGKGGGKGNGGNCVQDCTQYQQKGSNRGDQSANGQKTQEKKQIKLKKQDGSCQK
jgi:hypothetical protein